MLDAGEEEKIRYYADNVGYITLNPFARNTIEKKKSDIFEVLDRLLFPYDPIRDWSKREIKKIEESFKPIEDLINFAYL